MEISDRKKGISEGNLTERKRYLTERKSFLREKPDRKKAIYDKSMWVATCECPGETILEAQMEHGGTRAWSLKPHHTEPGTILVHGYASGLSWGSKPPSCISIRDKF